jgi:hypothetical protein
VSIFDKVLLVLLAIWGLVTAVLSVLFGTGAITAYHITVWSQTARDELYIAVVALIFALISVRFLVYRTGRPEPDYVVLPGEHGHVRISFVTFQQLADRTGQSIRGVDSFETRVRQGQGGILLAVRVRVLPDVDITQTSIDVQRGVKEHIERITGVTVERITVNVTEIASSGSKNTKAWVE